MWDFDFVYENFFHAKKILSEKNKKKQIYFVNDDMNNFRNFEKIILVEKIWTVQVLNSIEQIDQVLRESLSVLKKDGLIYNYHLNNSIIVKFKNIFFKN